MKFNRIVIALKIHCRIQYDSQILQINLSFDQSAQVCVRNKWLKSDCLKYQLECAAQSSKLVFQTSNQCFSQCRVFNCSAPRLLELQSQLNTILALRLLRPVQHRWHQGHRWKLRISLLCDSAKTLDIELQNHRQMNHHNVNQLYQQKMAYWRLGLRIAQPLSVMTADRAKNFWNAKLIKYSLVPGVCTSLFYYLRSREFNSVYIDQNDYQLFPGMNSEGKVVSTLKYIKRFIELGIIFAPTVICLPLYLFKFTRDWWISIFLNAIQRAGPVWIKTFQYLSHRRDVIGEDLAVRFQILREHTPTHEYNETQKTIKRVYGKQIREMFEQFSQKPVASGSISQVYKATMNGKIVAVKVRHPDIGKNIELDIDLMFTFSRALSKLSKFFEVPITQLSLKKILTSQLMFLKQKQNIDIFNTMNIDRNVRFPATYQESTNQVLIQEFIQGKTIAFYEKNPHSLNKVIANIGAKAFFAMLFKHNFVHTDCHAGNIMVKIHQHPNESAIKVKNFLNKAKNYLIAQVIKYGFDSAYLQNLSQQNYEYEKEVQNLADKFKERVEIVLIDVGMAMKLTRQKKQNFKNFLTEVIKGDPLQCAKWIYRISEYNGKRLKQFQNKKYFDDLQVMFKRVHQTSLERLEAIKVLYELLQVIRNHNMKIDGQISILLTNMLVLEQIAKDLDPSINILRCAVPYLHYQ